MELADGVLAVTLNRPDSLNSLSEAMLTGIAEALEQAATDPAVRVVKLSGAGRGFSSGAGISAEDVSAKSVNGPEVVLDAANRELMEETGHGAHRLEVLANLSLSPSYMGNRMTLVLARDLFEKRLAGDEPEPLIVSPMIQRAVSPAAIGPAPVRLSPGSSAMLVIWPGAA